VIREFHASFKSSEEVQQFLEMVQRFVHGVEYILDVRGSGVRIRLIGTPSEVEKAYYTIRGIEAAVKGRPGLKTYPLDLVFRGANTEAAIPGDLIVPALQLLGFNAKISRGNLVTDASFTEVINVVERLSSIYRRLMDEAISARAKRIVALYMLATGSDVDQAVEELVRLGILQIGATVSLSDDYERALNKLRSVLGGLAKARPLTDKEE